MGDRRESCAVAAGECVEERMEQRGGIVLGSRAAVEHGFEDGATVARAGAADRDAVVDLRRILPCRHVGVLVISQTTHEEYGKRMYNQRRVRCGERRR